MSSDPAHNDASRGDRRSPSAEAVKQELERVLASPDFVASDRLKGFLRFVVEEALAGRGDRLQAYPIALEVLGRDASFDPQSDPVVRMEAGRLRRRLERYYLGAGQSDPVRIDIPKGGYASVFQLNPGAKAGATPSREPHPATRPRALQVALLGLAGLGLAALLLATTVPWRSETVPVEAEAARPAPQERGPAIIVLPFEDLSEGDPDDVFASGLTEELISNLMRFGELRLYSAYASFLEQPTADPVELSGRLDVGYVVKGSVRRGPDQLRLIAHLIEAKTGQHLWTETYDRVLTPENMFAMQEQLAADVASQLARPYGIINEATAEFFRQERPETLFAYDCVLRAFDYRRSHGREKHAATSACLEEAVRRDPGYADAWALLAYHYLDEYRFGYGPRSYDPAALAQAVSTASHAVELDPDGMLPLLASSTVHFYRREFTEADEVNRRLLSLYPTIPEVLAQVGWRTACARDWDQGMALIRRAIERSIKAPWFYHIFVALDHYRRGDYHAALAEADPLPQELVSVPFVLAAIHGQLGNKAEAQRALDRAIALNPVFLKDPRAALSRSNIPEDVIEELIAGLAKVGLGTFPVIN